MPNDLDQIHSQSTAVQLSTSGPPPFLSPQSRDRLSRLHNRAQIGLPANEVDAEERGALSRRLDRVGASLNHRDGLAVINALTDVFLVMKTASASESDGEAIIAAYSSALRDLPSWAIVEACRKAVEGRAIGGKTFAPTAPELRAMVEDILAPIHREQAQLETVIRAADNPGPQEMTPEERETAAQKIGAMVVEMRKSEAEERAKDKAKHLAQVEKANEINAGRMVEEAEAAGIEPFADAEKKIPVSLSLRKLLKQQVQDDAMLQEATDLARQRLNPEVAA